MTIKEFNNQENILFMIYYRDHEFHIVKFDYTKRIKKEDINQNIREAKTFYGGLPNKEFHDLLIGRSREEAILEMTITSLNNSKLFSEQINHNNFKEISQVFLDKARIN